MDLFLNAFTIDGELMVIIMTDLVKCRVQGEKIDPHLHKEEKIVSVECRVEIRPGVCLS